MSCNCPPYPGEIKCRDIPNPVSKIRMYKRIPRKKKKQLKKLAAGLKAVSLCLAAASLAAKSVFLFKIYDKNRP